MEWKKLSTVLVMFVFMAGCAARKNQLRFASMVHRAPEAPTSQTPAPVEAGIATTPPPTQESPAANIEAAPPAPTPAPVATPRPNVETEAGGEIPRAMPEGVSHPPTASAAPQSEVKSQAADQVESPAPDENQGSKGGADSVIWLALIPLGAAVLWIICRFAILPAEK
ncbi:MAG TPA: hypothetical protein VMB85_03065 [Bryobacteraceae bacterium]|nr:hypothetical protein [Bryobacteraceae bacterium]